MLRRHNLSPFTQSKKSKIVPVPSLPLTTTTNINDDSLFQSLDDLVSLWEQRLAKSTTGNTLHEQHDQHETFDEHKEYNAVPPAVPDLNVDDEDDVDRPASSSVQNNGVSTTKHILTNEQTSNIPDASPQMVIGFPTSVGDCRTSQDYAVGSLGLYIAHHGSAEVQKNFPKVHDQIDIDITKKMNDIERMMKDRKKNKSKSTLAK